MIVEAACTRTKQPLYTVSLCLYDWWNFYGFWRWYCGQECGEIWTQMQFFILLECFLPEYVCTSCTWRIQVGQVKAIIIFASKVPITDCDQVFNIITGTGHSYDANKGFISIFCWNIAYQTNIPITVHKNYS